MMRKLLTRCCSVLLAAVLVAFASVSLSAQSKTRTLSGTVKDALTGEPIIGAAVMVKATNIGAITDMDGQYVLGVSEEKATIVASSLGYKDVEVLLNGKAVINFSLEPDTESLEDAVVIGYGAQKRATLTGALSVVSSKELAKTSSPSLSTALGGVVPGIVSRQVSGEPGYNSATLLIRGMGTWANASPLVLVDGVERDINLVNSEEIESFSILKDASATAVYGMRGANGVILINTKKGMISKPKVTFRSEFSNLHGLRFPNYIGAADFATLMNEACTVDGKPVEFSDEEIEKYRDGSDPYLYPDVDWVDECLKKNAFQTIDEITVSGGNEVARYFVAFGFSSQSGLFKEDPNYEYRTNSLSQRYNFRANVDINITKDVVFNVGLSEIIEDRTYPGTDASSIFKSLQIISPRAYPKTNPDGSIAGSSTSYEVDSPWRLVSQNGFAKQLRTTTQGNAGLKWDLGNLVTKGLSLEGNFSFDHWYFNEVFRRKTPEIKQYIGQDSDGEDVYQLIREEQAMSYALSQNSNRSYYWDVRLNYNRSFGKHTVGALMMFNRRDYKHLTAGDSTSNLPYRYQGLAGRLNYNYDERYLVEVNFGYNGSENFAKGHRYGFFPAASLGWILSNDDFFNVDFISHLKFRGSYGLVGNDAVGGSRFLYLSTTNKSANPYYFGKENPMFANGMAELKLGNEEVGWEVSKKLDLGLDVELFKGIVKLGADYFYEYRDHILLQRALLPDIFGSQWGDTPYANVGIMSNQGFDGNLEITQMTSNGFYYSLRGNFTFARNKIIEDDTAYHTYEYQDTRGRSAGLIYGYTALGLFQSQEEVDNSPKQELDDNYGVGDVKYADLNNDGVINNYDKSFIGYGRTPEIMYGFGVTLGYKGFDLSLNFTGAGHTNILLDEASMWPFSLNYPSYNILHEYYDNRFIPGEDNTNAKYPIVHYGKSENNFQVSTLYMHNAAYLKLKVAEFGYTLPKKAVSKLHLDNLRIYVNGNNLFSIDKVKLIDPETEHMGSARYPTQRTTTLGLQIGF